MICGLAEVIWIYCAGWACGTWKSWGCGCWMIKLGDGWIVVGWGRHKRGWLATVVAVEAQIGAWLIIVGCIALDDEQIQFCVETGSVHKNICCCGCCWETQIIGSGCWTHLMKQRKNCSKSIFATTRKIHVRVMQWKREQSSLTSSNYCFSYTRSDCWKTTIILIDDLFDGLNTIPIDNRWSWLRTDHGGTWLRTDHGRTWLRTDHGGSWLPTDHGGTWLRTDHGGKIANLSFIRGCYSMWD